MLYDPARWDHQPATAAPDLSLAGLIAWLEQQDPATKYDWKIFQTCLVGRYVEAVIGIKPGTFTVGYEEKIFHNNREYHKVTKTKPQTYGAALERARAALAVT